MVTDSGAHARTLIANAVSSDNDPARWRMLALLACAELLGMALWFTGSAVGPTLARAWSLSTAQVGWLTTAVQLGFVVGTAISALLNLASTLRPAAVMPLEPGRTERPPLAQQPFQDQPP